jgi:hypothetical protein
MVSVVSRHVHVFQERIVRTKFRVKAAGCHGRPGSLACSMSESWPLTKTGYLEEPGKETAADLEDEE